MTLPRPVSLVTLLVLAILLLGCRSSQPEVTPESPVLFEPWSIGVSSDGRHVTMPCRAWASGIGYQQYESCGWDSGTGRRASSGMGQGTWSVWSPTGTLYATAQRQVPTVAIWDLAERRAIRFLKGHEATPVDGEVRAVGLSFSPDGTQLASAFERDSTVRLWRVSDGTALHVLDLAPQQPQALAFSPDGARLAVATTTGEIQLWSVATGERLPTTGEGEGPRGTVVTFSPDGGWLAAADPASGLLALWDATTLQPLMTFPEPLEVRGLDFSPDSTRLVFSSAGDRTIRLWAPDGGEQLIFTGHADAPQAVRFSPDGRYLYSGSEREGVFQWDVERLRYSAGLTCPRRCFTEGHGSGASRNLHKTSTNRVRMGANGGSMARSKALIDESLACSIYPGGVRAAANPHKAPRACGGGDPTKEDG